MSRRKGTLGGVNIHGSGTQAKPARSENPGQAGGAEAETWAPVAGYEGWYEVSDLGRVRRVGAPQCRRLHSQAGGYVSVRLGRPGTDKKTLQVHVLVAKAFLGPRPAGRQVNHKDANKHNPRLDNLEYVTPARNREHAIGLGIPVHCWSRAEASAAGKLGGGSRGPWTAERRARQMARYQVAS